MNSMSGMRDYVRLAERRSGLIPRDADDSYIWGMAIEEFATRLRDVKIVSIWKPR